MGRKIKLKEAALAVGVALSLAQQITGAMAFSTETVAPAPQSNGQAAPMSPFGQQLVLPGQQGVPQGVPADPLAFTGKPSGTEVVIPGIGSVGTLPKLDFGLELLYGSKFSPDSQQVDPHSLDQHLPEGDVQIKGTLSHKF
jgi:hypothetical protein